MSFRYAAGFDKPGFNPLGTQTPPGVQYSGSWNLSSQAQAKGQTTWPSPPAHNLLSWGTNFWGELGVGNIKYYSSPKQVGSLSNWSKVAHGVAFSSAIKRKKEKRYYYFYEKNRHGIRHVF